MHTSHLSRRRFLSLSGAAAVGSLFATRFARACPMIKLPPSEEAKKIASAINAFAADMHARIARDEKGELFFSPFSIETALAMTSAGAKGGTLNEMQKTLHLPPEPHAAFGELIRHLNTPKMTRGGTEAFPKALDGGPPIGPTTPAYQLSVANAIWAQKDFPWHKEFVELTHANYGAGVVETDFGKGEAARKQINDWVEKETKEKIKELIPPGVITGLTRMILCNAIYFKSKWQTEFDPKNTREEAFTCGGGTKRKVPMMHLTGEFKYGEMTTFFLERGGEKVQVLELPYTGNELSMLVFLPEDQTGADRLPRSLGGEDFTSEKLRAVKVNVSLPRFKAETKYSLKPMLMDLGMKSAFGVADFTGMSPLGKELFISHVLHKAFVEVNEEGTEAAAATGVAIKQRVSLNPKVVEFRADRPFVYAIRDNATGAVLFLGRYSGPA